MSPEGEVSSLFTFAERLFNPAARLKIMGVSSVLVLLGLGLVNPNS